MPSLFIFMCFLAVVLRRAVYICISFLSEYAEGRNLSLKNQSVFILLLYIIFFLVLFYRILLILILILLVPLFRIKIS